MKKILALLLACLMAVGMFAACAPANNGGTTPETTEAPTEPVTPDPDHKIAFITDTGNIDDHSFNQYSFEGVTKFAAANGMDYKYYKPNGDTDQDRIDAINTAIADGYNMITMAGYLFGPAVYQCAVANPETMFLALDVTEFDLKDASGKDGVTAPANLALICYKEEQCGYLAGYAAVVDGYKNLGFLGGISVPAVVRYGYGFIQGADAAAKELGYNDVTIKYWYSNAFWPTDEIATKMDAWYVDGTEIVFSCGGGIYQSCLSAADANDGKMIGVDVDQSNISDRFVTSAMKSLSNSVVVALGANKANGYTWPEAYAGTCQFLGAAEDCVGLPMGTSQFTSFTQEQYDSLFGAMADGSLMIDNSSNPAVTPNTEKVTVIYE